VLLPELQVIANTCENRNRKDISINLPRLRRMFLLQLRILHSDNFDDCDGTGAFIAIPCCV
jgi:hypothetical protein